jgi:hypothetical protein
MGFKIVEAKLEDAETIAKMQDALLSPLTPEKFEDRSH